jgi:tetratricopeptide (TPR) repeat protein
MSETTDFLQRHANTLLRQGRRPEAIDAFRRLLSARPDYADGWYNLGYLLKSESQYDAALAAYGEALAQGVKDPEEVFLNRAVIYSDFLRRDEAAELELRAALERNPRYLPALLNLGNLQEERRRRAEAAATYERALAFEPHPRDGRARDLQGEALARLAQLRAPRDPEDPLLSRLKQASEDAALGPTARANLLFARGRACDVLGLHDQAFADFAAANRLARQPGPPYSRVRARRFTDALVRTFQPAPASGAEAVLPRVQPLFICGMFRSGSTLLEQVLAAHPAVTAGGEIDFLPRLVRGPLAPFPASMGAVDEAGLAKLAGDYQAHLERLFPGAGPGTLVTDKRPDNFQLIGLIKRLFPGARIIHTIRQPLDNGLSIFMQHLDQRAMSYSSDLGDIGHHYGEYQRLMAHWKRLFGDSILDFDYDDFVRAPRPALQRLLEFLGLEWDDRCLEFHTLDNTVKTASYWQVRRPLYREASGRWRNYRMHLGPLVSTLREAGIKLEETG